MLSVSFGSNAAYLYRHAEERRDPERGNYYLSAAEHGEPAGEWLAGGAEALGLTGQVDKETMHLLYDEFVHPQTGEQLGRRPYRFADQKERLAAAIEAEGSDVLPEREAELALSVAKSNREARNYADLTFSMPKSWSVLHASLERAERHEDAEKVWTAIMEGADAGLAYFKEHAGYSRAGRHGAEVAGRTTGRWVEAKDWVASAWRHHTSRDGDPQLHVHVAVLNRVLCEDGRWRTLDSRAITRARAGAAAIAERVAEEALTRDLNVRFATRPDGLAREIVGIDESARDLFSSRRRAISDNVAERVSAYTEKYGHAPNAYTLRLMSEQATLETRIRKPEHPPTRAELLDEWEERTRSVLGERLDELATATRRDDEPAMEPFVPETVIARALADIEESRSVWTRHDLVAAVNRELPDCLGGLRQSQVRAVVDELVDSALSPGGGVIKLSAPELVPAPPELRRADGRSVYEPPTAERYATTRQLELEELVLNAAGRTDVTPVDPQLAERLISTSVMSEAQAAAVKEIMTSGRNTETFIGAPGVGKTFTSAELARLWTEATGKPVLGLTTAERATQVLRAEGFKHASNIAKWQHNREAHAESHEYWTKIRDEIRARQTGAPLTPGRALTDSERQVLARADRELKNLEAQMLVPGQLVIVDEASMVTTKDLADIVLVAEAQGAKVVFSGDDRQLGAVGAGGMFRLLAQDDRAVRLEEPRRFVHSWEAQASLRLRSGDHQALIDYDRHGRFLNGSREEMLEAARQAYLGDHLLGKTSLLVVPTNEMASQLSSQVREELIRLGVVQDSATVLRDHNRVGVGDLIAARENDAVLGVVNRETYVVREVHPDGSLVVSAVDNHDASGNVASRTLPADYVGRHVELAYASTTHSTQGRTVERCHSLVDPERTSREALLVDLTRGKEGNFGYVVTHDLDSEMHTEPVAPMSVLSKIMDRNDGERAAVEVQREELEAVDSLARLEPQWADVVGAGNVDRYAEQVRAHVGDEMMDRIEHDDAASSIYRSIRAHELAGGDVNALLERVTRDQLDTADSPASVLSWRISQAEAGQRSALTYAERTPDRSDPAGLWAKQLADAMDNRTRELGEQAAVEPQPAWTKELGPVPDDPTDRAEWTHRAGAVAAYREAHGYRGDDAIGAAPPQGAVEARASWEVAYDALGRPEADRDVAQSTDAQLERIVDTWERDKQWAPPNVDKELAETHHASRRWETEAAIEAAELRQLDLDDVERHASELITEGKQRLAADLRERAGQLEKVAAARSEWYEETAEDRRRSTLAQREQDRRSRMLSPQVEEDPRPAPSKQAELTERDLPAREKALVEREPISEQPAADGGRAANIDQRRQPDREPDRAETDHERQQQTHEAVVPGADVERPATADISDALARAERAREIVAERRAERTAEAQAAEERSQYHAVEQQRSVEREQTERSIDPSGS